MKEIKLPVKGTIEPTPGKPVNLGKAIKNRKFVAENRRKIIDASLCIESEVEDIIMAYFFSERKEMMRFFNDTILKTSFFGFRNKIKVLEFILERTNIKSKINKPLDRVIIFRNAFVHGEIVEKSDGTYIRCFRGKEIKQKLNDAYWSNVEAAFKESYELLQEIKKKLKE